ncbi:MAG: hypothetical protein NTX25_21615 [Proteobacteria bacterium]|nr:hypothetical protein [Pseudomonadota bacterium]
MNKQLKLICLILLFVPSYLIADENSLREAMQKLEERLSEHINDGFIKQASISPLAIVSVTSDNDQIQHITTSLAESLQRATGAKILICDRCNISHEILSIRMVVLNSGELIFASTIDSKVEWSSRSMRNFTDSRLRERQVRGEAIIHRHIDLGLLPLGGAPHIGWSIMQQWGSSNQYLSGISISLSNPLLGIGVNWFKVFPRLNNSLIGFKVLGSIPELLTKSLSKGSGSSGLTGDQALTVLGMIKYPLFGQPEQFYLNAYVSSGGSIGFGLSF